MRLFPQIGRGHGGRGFLAGAAVCLLAGCKPVGPNYHKPDFTAPPAYKETGAPTVTPPPNPADGGWKPATPSDGMLRGKWWEVFNDPQLNQYEERAAEREPAAAPGHGDLPCRARPGGGGAGQPLSHAFGRSQLHTLPEYRSIGRWHRRLRPPATTT